MMHRVTVYPPPQDMTAVRQRIYYPATNTPHEALADHLKERTASRPEPAPVCVFTIGRLYWLTRRDGSIVEAGAVTVAEVQQ